MNKIPAKASDQNDLERHVLDPNISKSEAEWWAKSRIEELASIVEFQKKAWTAYCAERDQLREQVTMLRSSLLASANYIDTLGGNSVDSRRNLAATEPTK